MRKVLIATSNPAAPRLRRRSRRARRGNRFHPKLRVAAAVIEDGQTFEANARKKAEQYSRAVPGEIVLADDSGLEVDSLEGAPGVHSARYDAAEPHKADHNTDD